MLFPKYKFIIIIVTIIIIVIIIITQCATAGPEKLISMWMCIWDNKPKASFKLGGDCFCIPWC